MIPWGVPVPSFPFICRSRFGLYINRECWVEPEPIGAFNEVLVVDQEVLYRYKYIRMAVRSGNKVTTYQWTLDKGSFDERKTVLDTFERDLRDNVTNLHLRDVVLNVVTSKHQTIKPRACWVMELTS